MEAGQTTEEPEQPKRRIVTQWQVGLFVHSAILCNVPDLRLGSDYLLGIHCVL